MVTVDQGEEKKEREVLKDEWMRGKSGKRIT